MSSARPLGPPRLVKAIQERSVRPLRGVALFATTGTVSASVTAMNPMLSGRRQMADVAVRTAHTGLPQVVGLAVDEDGIDVYPLTLSGHVTDDAITRWGKGAFSAATSRRLLVIQLAIVLRSGNRFQLETKSFPIGVNKHNATVAHMIVGMANAQSVADSGPGPA